MQAGAQRALTATEKAAAQAAEAGREAAEVGAWRVLQRSARSGCSAGCLTMHSCDARAAQLSTCKPPAPSAPPCIHPQAALAGAAQGFEEGRREAGPALDSAIDTAKRSAAEAKSVAEEAAAQAVGAVGACWPC